MSNPTTDVVKVVNCPFCHTPTANHSKTEGRPVRCATCRNVYLMPLLPAAAVTPPAAAEAPKHTAGTFAAQYPWRPVVFDTPVVPAAHANFSASNASAENSVSNIAPPAPIAPVPELNFGEAPLPPAELGQLEVMEKEDDELAEVKQSLWRSGPAFVVSAAVHAACLVLLGLLVISSTQLELPVEIELAFFKDDGKQLDFEPLDVKVDTPEPVSLPDLTPSTPVQVEDPLSAPLPLEIPSLDSLVASSQMDVPTIGMALQGRDEGTRAALLRKYGGNEASETAVGLGLEWLKEIQLADGSWNFKHSDCPRCRGKCKNPGTIEAKNGATALVLLPFLGAGQTHRDGRYQETVRRGLYFLMNQVKRTRTPQSGDLQGTGGNLYCHGLATIALCEAYAMTQDDALKMPAQKALEFITYAQDQDGGGWRYTPGQPGDTSAVGWQLMALKSGHMAYLTVPPKTIGKAVQFLDSVQGDGGATYGYTGPGQGAATTAIGLLCRMYLGWPKDHEALVRGVGYLGDAGPSRTDMYYNYYATQVMHHYGGEPWTRWNELMRDQLVSSQAKDGHERGSWWSMQSWNMTGGRVYQTAMSVMILEVYYRHLPIYRDNSLNNDFNFPVDK